jgi:pyrimidine-nucleoside phosphorylase
MGKRIIALLTDMDEPLGNKVGNFLEVEECLDCLEGRGPSDLMEVTLELAARMLVLGKKAATPDEGRLLCEKALAGGEPLKRFLSNVRSQGGDPDKLLAQRGEYRSKYRGTVAAGRSCYISRIDAYKVGIAGVGLGVGRNRTEDSVSPTAGIELHRKRGARVQSGETIMTVWGKDEACLAAALPLLADAVEYSDAAPGARRLVLKEIASA